MASKTFYKATRPDGYDFRTGTVDYSVIGSTVEVSAAKRKQPAFCCTDTVLHASTSAADTLIGGLWPCRLFEVSGRPVAEEGNKRGFRKLTVVREVDGWLALGPQGKEVAALIEQAKTVTPEQAKQLHAARDAAWGAALGATWDAALDAARGAAWEAAWDAARDAARGAAWDAARALVVRDLIDQADFDTLYNPWFSVMGKAV